MKRGGNREDAEDEEIGGSDESESRGRRDYEQYLGGWVVIMMDAHE